MSLFAENLIAVEASREAAKARLDEFLPRAGRYAKDRNVDYGPGCHDNVSCLSPYLTQRLILEAEVCHAAQEHFAPSTVQKFVEEVCWRTYFKGYLEMRPQIWADYLHDLQRMRDFPGHRDIDKARRGETGIQCFDDWARELVETGYLHNHARMWFASIWVFTLGLPWQSGAAFFLENLIDGDPASNTLSWRWVSGLHTRGKNYVARASNIERNTNGRYNPRGQLNEQAGPLEDAREYRAGSIQFGETEMPEGRSGLLITDEDCAMEIVDWRGDSFVAVAGALAQEVPEELEWSEKVQIFRGEAIQDAVQRAATHFGAPGTDLDAGDWLASVNEWIESEELDQVVVANPPVGPWRDFFTRIEAQLSAPLIRVTREWDRILWPHATAGYFKFKKELPRALARLSDFV